MSNIYIHHHDAGIVNQLMSVELICGLAAATKNKISVIKPYWRNEMPICISGNSYKNLKRVLNHNEKPLIYDLIDFPSDLINFTNFIDIQFDEIGSLIESYFDCDPLIDNFDEEVFSEGRNKLIFLEGKKYLFKKWSFGLYSRFFYHRTPEIDKILSCIKFKKEYHDLAKKISEDLGRFNGLHVRGTDHRKNYNANRGIVESAIRRLRKDGKKVVLCTDEDVKYDNCLLLHNFIIENYAESFKSLPFSDAAVFSIINLLVMTYSEEFAGTPGSTYTGYIHRCLYQNSPHNFCFLNGEEFPYSPIKGKYSWNDFNMHTMMKSWWREWPECKLNVLE